MTPAWMANAGRVGDAVIHHRRTGGSKLPWIVIDGCTGSGELERDLRGALEGCTSSSRQTSAGTGGPKLQSMDEIKPR